MRAPFNCATKNGELSKSAAVLPPYSKAVMFKRGKAVVK
jgi:hypothetical protein